MDEIINKPLNEQDTPLRESPFIYRDGMELVREGELKDVTRRFVGKYLSNDVGGIKYDIIKTVYEYTFLNRNTLERILASSRPGVDLKSAIAHLVKFGMLRRLHCVYGTHSTPYFYAVGTGVSEMMRMDGYKTSTLPVYNPVTAISILSRNQFIASAMSSPAFIKGEMHTLLHLKEKDRDIDLGYSAILRVSDGGELRLLTVPVRRSPGWEKDVVNRLVLVKAYSNEYDNTRTIPVCICEDATHMEQVSRLISTNDRISGRTYLFCTDADTFEKDITNSHLKARVITNASEGEQEFEIIPAENFG